MTQLQITAFGDPSVLRLNPSLDKVPAEGEVRVRICFAGVNPIDAKTRAGLGWAAAQNKDKLPWTPGYDVSGVVEKVGPNVTTLVEGDKVCGMVAFPDGRWLCGICGGARRRAGQARRGQPQARGGTAAGGPHRLAGTVRAWSPQGRSAGADPGRCRWRGPSGGAVCRRLRDPGGGHGRA